MTEPLAMAPLSVELPNRRATRHLARKVAEVIRGGDLLVLGGELGAGKTFFVRALCHALGLPARVRVTSPTFTLVHEIPTHPAIVHSDLYRVTSRREVDELGLLEHRDGGALVVVEWGVQWIGALGGDAFWLELQSNPRRGLLRATGQRSTEALKALGHPSDASSAPR